MSKWGIINPPRLPMSKWECADCKTEFDEDEITSKLVFMGNREEPSEYAVHCPNCDSVEIDEINIPLCVCCEDEFVKREGMACTECMTCHAEAIADDRKGH
jgi:hypothetical protein